MAGGLCIWYSSLYINFLLHHALFTNRRYWNKARVLSPDVLQGHNGSVRVAVVKQMIIIRWRDQIDRCKRASPTLLPATQGYSKDPTSIRIRVLPLLGSGWVFPTTTRRVLAGIEFFPNMITSTTTCTKKMFFFTGCQAHITKVWGAAPPSITSHVVGQVDFPPKAVLLFFWYSDFIRFCNWIVCTTQVSQKPKQSCKTDDSCANQAWISPEIETLIFVAGGDNRKDHVFHSENSLSESKTQKMQIQVIS
jgi:hypothetical protein